MIGKYPLNNRFVRGKLTANNSKAVSDFQCQYNLYRVFAENQMRRFVYMDSRWDDNCIMFDHKTNLGGTHEGGLEFIRTLSAILKSNEAAKFGFTGSFTVVIQTFEEPIVFRINVENQNITYQELTASWTEPTAI